MLTRRRLLLIGAATLTFETTPGFAGKLLRFGGALPAPADTWNDTPVGTAPILDSTYAFVRNLTETINYYGKGPDIICAPNEAASTTKLMANLVAVTNRGSVFPSATATVQAGDIVGGTTANFQVGQVYTLADCMAGSLIPSGNDATMTLARFVGNFLSGGGGIPRFVTEMNTTAAALLMTSTVYGTPYGVNGIGATNITTARDLARLVNASLLDPTVQALTSPSLSGVSNTYTATLTALPAGTNPGPNVVINSNPLWSPAASPQVYTGIEGMKGGNNGAGIYSEAVLWQTPNGDQIVITLIKSQTDVESRVFDATAIWYKMLRDFPTLAGVDIDANFANDVFLLDTEGPLPIDVSSYNRAITINGAATLSTSNPIIEAKSLKLNGSTDYLSSPNAAELQVGSSDFTIETFFAGDGTAPITFASLLSKYDVNGNQRGWNLIYAPDTRVFTFFYSLTGTDFPSIVFNIGTWLTDAQLFNGNAHHIAVDCHVGTIWLYFDGIRNRVSATPGAAIFPNTAPLRIGARGGAGGTIDQFWRGYLDEPRITIGTSRYLGVPKITPLARPWARS